MAEGVSAPQGLLSYWQVEDERSIVRFPLEYATTEEEAIDVAIRHSYTVFEWQRPGLKATRHDGHNGHVS